MNIGRENGADKEETIPINQSTQLVPLYIL